MYPKLEANILLPERPLWQLADLFMKSNLLQFTANMVDIGGASFLAVGSHLVIPQRFDPKTIAKLIHSDIFYT